MNSERKCVFLVVGNRISKGHKWGKDGKCFDFSKFGFVFSFVFWNFQIWTAHNFEMLHNFFLILFCWKYFFSKSFVISFRISIKTINIFHLLKIHTKVLHAPFLICEYHHKNKISGETRIINWSFDCLKSVKLIVLDDHLV